MSKATYFFEKGDIIYTDKYMVVKEDANDNVRLSEVAFDGPWKIIANLILSKNESILKLK